MRVLALDTSQIQAALCTIVDGAILKERAGSVDVAHSESLLPHLHELLRLSGLRLDEIDAFAAGVGPGSFTGIRIGCATVKALAQVLSKPVLPFSSLRATACSADAGQNTVAVVNAYQGQVFVGWWQDGSWVEDAMTAAVWRETVGAALSKNAPLIFSGSGAELYRAELEQLEGARFSGVTQVSPKGILGALEGVAAMRYGELAANYLRPSQAEVKLGVSLAK